MVRERDEGLMQEEEGFGMESLVVKEHGLLLYPANSIPIDKRTERLQHLSLQFSMGLWSLARSQRQIGQTVGVGGRRGGD